MSNLPRSHHRALAEDALGRNPEHVSWRQFPEVRDRFFADLRAAGLDLGDVHVAMGVWGLPAYWRMEDEGRADLLRRLLASAEEVHRLGVERAESVDRRYQEWLAEEGAGHALVEGGVPCP